MLVYPKVMLAALKKGADTNSMNFYLHVVGFHCLFV